MLSCFSTTGTLHWLGQSTIVHVLQYIKVPSVEWQTGQTLLSPKAASICCSEQHNQYSSCWWRLKACWETREPFLARGQRSRPGGLKVESSNPQRVCDGISAFPDTAPRWASCVISILTWLHCKSDKRATAKSWDIPLSESTSVIQNTPEYKSQPREHPRDLTRCWLKAFPSS